MYGNGSDTRRRFALCYPEDALPEVDVLLCEGQQFTATHTGIEQNENGIRTGNIGMEPYPVYGLPGERMMRFNRFILAELQQRSIVYRNYFKLYAITQYKAYHGAHFLNGTERKVLLFHGINDLLEVHELQLCDRHFLQGSTMPERVMVIVYGALRRFYIRRYAAAASGKTIQQRLFCGQGGSDGNVL